jgi:Fic family protein
VWLGGDTPHSARFVPPQWHRVEDLIADLERFIHYDDSVEPLVKAALVHAQFETVHPFLDGNGRVGRILIPLILREAGRLPSPAFYISLYFKRYRDSYYDALQAIRVEGDWEGWVKFFLRAVADVADNVFSTTKRLRALTANDMRRVMESARKSPVTQNVFLFASRQVMLTSPAARLAVESSSPSVNNAIRRLESMGILEEVTGKRRNRVYVYSDYLDILNEE